MKMLKLTLIANLALLTAQPLFGMETNDNDRSFNNSEENNPFAEYTNWKPVLTHPDSILKCIRK